MDIIVNILKKKDTKENCAVMDLFKLNATGKADFNLTQINYILTHYKKPFRNSRTIEKLTNKELLRIFKLKKTLYYFNSDMEISINLKKETDTANITDKTKLVTKKINKYSTVK